MKKRGGGEMPKELSEDMRLFIYPQNCDWWKYLNMPLKSFCYKQFQWISHGGFNFQAGLNVE